MRASKASRRPGLARPEDRDRGEGVAMNEKQHVLFYYRPGCSECTEAHEFLERLGVRYQQGRGGSPRSRGAMGLLGVFSCLHAACSIRVTTCGELYPKFPGGYVDRVERLIRRLYHRRALLVKVQRKR